MSLKNYSFLGSDNISTLISLLDLRYSIGQASNVKFGLVKLYDGTGDNVDGTMTQQAISQRLSSIYRFKGSLEDYEDLPKNPQIGDVYNIANPNVPNHIKAGDNLAWNGTGWDNLSGLMDLSNYLQKNGEYIKSVNFNGELKTITFLLPDNSTESIILPAGLNSEELEVQDLDLLLDVGVYPIDSLSGLSHLPIQELGSLLIFSDKTYTHQLYYTLSGNFFVRVYNHSLHTWTDWSNIKTKLKQVYAETTDLANPDFNDISLAVCSIENITSATNYPIAKRGLLQNVIGNSYNFQIYTTIDGQVFNRCKINNTWSSWKEIAPIITIITSGNLNDFTEHKTYHISDTNNSILNKPDSSQLAEFIVTSSEGYIYQKYINSSNTVYIRNKAISDTDFSSWKFIIDSSSITAYAPLNSPTLIGSAVYNESITKTDNSKKIANTEFVKNNLADYAPLNSASLTGTPILSTEIAKTDNSKKVANTEFVNNYVTEILKDYALLASPSLTGNPTAPTQDTSNSSTRLATTAYVKNNLSSYAPLASPTFTGSPKAPTQNVSDNSTNIATTKYVNDLISNVLENYATLDSPVLTGTAILNVSLAKTDNSKKIANTEFVKNNLADYMLSSTIQSTYAPLVSPTFTGEPKSVTPLTTDNSIKIATTEYVNNLATSKLESYAPLASPEFSGTPKSPDVIAGDSTTKIANTKFVSTAVSNALTSYAPLNSPNLTGTPTTPDITAGTSTGQIANTKFVMTAIANLIDSAPETLNTLSELSSALNDDPSFATNVMTAIGEKLPLAGGKITGNLTVGGTLTTTSLIGNTGNTTTAGLTKLYTGIGTATDGSMTQNAIKSALDEKMSSSTTVTNVVQTKKSDNAEYPIVMVGTSNQTDTTTTGVTFATGVKINPSISTIYATTFSGNATSATKATNDSDNNAINTTYAKLSGATFTGGISGTTGTFSGTLILSKTTDLSGTANNSPALIVGGAVTSTHMEIDKDEIQAKTNGTSVAQLYLNNDGGAVNIGSGGLIVNGNITASEKTITAGTFSGALTGDVTGNCSGTSSNVTGTVAIANGGTGATTVAKARENLFGTAMNTSALAKYVITTDDSWINGGYTTLQQLRNFMGLGNTTGALPVANGGTGQTSLADITGVGSALKATGDKNGADITTTYETKANAITGLTLLGATLTVTKGNSTSSTITFTNYYGICSSVADAIAKEVSITGYTLVTGTRITVKFSIANTADNPTLNVSSTGAKPIYYRGYPIPAKALQANSTYDLVYNGTEYEIIGSVIWTE